MTIKLWSQEQTTTYQQTITQLLPWTSEEQQQIMYIIDNQTVLQYEVQEEQIVVQL